jgi:hypothetical protein
VLLYVRSDADYDALRRDWTAVHELSHLYHPYLGESGRWLAEGLASYYQNVFRARAGVLGANEAWERLDAGFRRGEAADSGVRLDAMGRGRGGTMRVYWAGAGYWLEADLALRRERGISLDAVLDQYTECCLHGGDSIAPLDFVAALDRVADGDAFTTLYRRYAASRVFPALDDAYRRLGIVRGEDGLEFSSDNGTRAAQAGRDQQVGDQLRGDAAPMEGGIQIDAAQFHRRQRADFRRGRRAPAQLRETGPLPVLFDDQGQRVRVAYLTRLQFRMVGGLEERGQVFRRAALAIGGEESPAHQRGQPGGIGQAGGTDHGIVLHGTSLCLPLLLHRKRTTGEGQDIAPGHPVAPRFR